MGYQVYEDRDARDSGVDRWAGYGVPAVCDWPDCAEKIDRGLGYKCEEHVWYEEPDDDDDIEHVDDGCGLYFCEKHRSETGKHGGITPKPDTAEWRQWMLSDESWQQWRDENPGCVAQMMEATDAV